MVDWLFATLKQYPEIAIFLTLGIGYYFGKFTFKGIGLGSVTATLLAGVIIGQIGITIAQPLKATVFLMFLFAVGYGVGPQFVRGVAKDGLPQAIFTVVQCLFSLLVPVGIAKIAGYDLGYAAGLYSGSQTISAAMGLSTDAINRLGLAADQAKALIDSMPVAYAVSYMFGTMGSAVVIAVLGPKLLGINLEAACKDYEAKFGGGSKEVGGPGTAWRRWEVRAYRIQPGGRAAGLTVLEAEALAPHVQMGGLTAGVGVAEAKTTQARLFIQRIRRNGTIEDATPDTVLQVDDVVAVAGARDVLVSLLGEKAKEVEDPELLAMPVQGIDVFVSNKAIDGKTLAELAQMPETRGIFLRKITRGATATSIPILANTTIQRGDILSIAGRTQDTNVATTLLGVADRQTDVADMAFVGVFVVIGALFGSLVLNISGVPLTLSTAGGALVAGIVGGWLRSVRPTFGRVPSPTIWFMNSVGLNIFIAIVGISAGPGFVNGLKTQGVGLFLWGALATTVPLVLGMFVAKYLFKFHDALTLGIVSGARTTTASLGLVCDQAKSQVPALGYTVTYAVGNTLLTIWGMVLIILLGEPRTAVYTDEDAFMDELTLKQYEKLGPFEIKDFLAKAATKAAQESSLTYLNAGRGNPNWVATEPREGYFLLGQFAITESKRVLDLPPGVGGMPKAPGIAARLEAWLTKHEDMPGAPFLQRMVPFAVKKFDFDPDKFVHELVDSIIGDHYPVPDRMLVHNERIVHEYLEWAMCGSPHPKGTFKIYAVEGGTAAMCYIFKSLKSNRIINQGDTIALGVPIFTPYLEMAHLEDYDLHFVEVHAKQENRFQYPDEELEKLLDPKIKAFFIVNPGNPYAVALSPETIKKIGTILEKRPDLILLTDDVYGTFVPGFRSLMGAFPKNTIGVYSYSKYFGCTGWRLGTIAVHEDNIFDEMIANHPEPIKKLLDKRYGGLTLEPRKLAFIDRIVADSRDVGLNHTAGLSLPQQVMMSMFSLAELMDEKKDYQKACIGIVKKRVEATLEGLGIEISPNEHFDYYYGLIDFEFFARKNIGEDAVDWMKANVHPLDIVFRLAEDHGIVLLNGSGFAAPDWSVRISFANLDDHVYDDIGRALRAIARGYRQAYEAAIANPAAVVGAGSLPGGKR